MGEVWRKFVGMRKKKKKNTENQIDMFCNANSIIIMNLLLHENKLYK